MQIMKLVFQEKCAYFYGVLIIISEKLFKYLITEEVLLAYVVAQYT